MSVEERMAKIEGAFEEVDKRLNHIETEMGELRTEARELRGQLGAEIRELRGQIGAEIRELRRSLFFLIIPMWVTIIGAIIGVAVV